MNGGFGPMTAVVGKPHMFKSTMAKSMLYIALLRVLTTIKTSALMYDTEYTVIEEHQREIFEEYMKHKQEFLPFFKTDDVVDDLIQNETIVFTNKKQWWRVLWDA